jgi:hypothetical protein
MPEKVDLAPYMIFNIIKHHKYGQIRLCLLCESVMQMRTSKNKNPAEPLIPLGFFDEWW